MSAEVTLTGSGTIGPVAEGWKVEQSATPVAIGDTSGSVGAASLEAASTRDSVFAIDNGFELTDANLGTFTGQVINSPVTGARVSLDAKGALSAFVATRTTGALDDGTAAYRAGSHTLPVSYINRGMVAHGDGSFSYVSRLIPGAGYITIRTVAADETETVLTLTSLGSTIPRGLAYDESTGNFYVATGSAVHRVDPTGTVVNSFGSAGSANGQFGGWDADTNGLHFNQTTGQLYVADYGNNRVQYFTAAGVYVGKWTVTGPSVLCADASFVYVMNQFGTLTEYTPTGTLSRTTTATFLSTHNFKGINVSRDGSKLVTLANTVAGTDARLIVVELAAWEILHTQDLGEPANTLAADDTFVYVGNLTTGGASSDTVQRFIVGGTLHGAFAYYCALVGLEWMNYLAAANPAVTVPGWTGDVWTRIKEMCAIFDVELSHVDGLVTVREIGSVSATIDSRTVPTITPSNLGTGRQINIVVRNPVAGRQAFYADTDGSFGVTVPATSQFTVRTSNTPTSLERPTFSPTIPVGLGQFAVVDANGARVTSWAGTVTVAIGADLGELDFTITAPTTPAGFTGPFTIDQISIAGRGVTVTPTLVELLTGADESKVTRQVAYTVDSPFMDTLERAYDRGSWASETVGGGSLVITFDLPSESLGGFGVTPGAMFELESCRWRITDVTFGRVRSTITATRHVTMGELDAVWAGQTLGTIDTFWAGYSAGDRTIRPLAR